MAQSSMTWSSNSPFVRDRFTWLAYLMLAYFAYLQAALGPLMPFLRDELNLNYTLAGLHFSAFALGMVLAGLSGDRLARRWGRWIVFWGGGAGMAAGALCLVLGSRVAVTVAGTFIMGWLGAFLLVMIQAGLSDRHAEARAVALTESNLGASISAGLAPVFVGGFQRLGLGGRGALVLAVLVLALIGARFLRVSIPDTRGASPRSGPAGRGLPLSFWAYWLVIILCVSVEWCLVFWGADFLESSLGLSKVNAATTMSIFFLAMVLGRLSGSRLSRAVSSANLLLFALGISLAGFPIFWLARCAPLNIAGLFVAGFGVANLFPLTLSVAVGLDPTQSDMASARVSLGAGLAILIAPLALGWTADQVDIQNAYGIVALLLVWAIAVAVLARRWVTRDASGQAGS
jgi:fucose permease